MAKLTKQEKLEKKKLAERARKARIKNDPTLYELFKEKDRQRYHKRKAEGKIKSINTLPRRIQKIMRAKSRESSRKHNYKKKQTANRETLIEIVPEEKENKENCDPLGQSLLPSPSVSNINQPRATSPFPSVSSGTDSPAPSSPLSDSSVRVRLRSRFLAETHVNSSECNENIIQKPKRKAPSQRSNLKKYKYRVNKEFKLLHHRITELKTQKENYKKQLFRLKRRNEILSKKNITPEGKDNDSSISEDQNKNIMTMLQKMKIDVQMFYEDDENSRMCPGKKDCVTKNKTKQQKRFLTESLCNLYKKFKVEHPEYTISYSYFCKLRPFWVQIPNVQNRDTCQCQIHENFDLVISALRRRKLLTETNAQEVLDTLCCDKTNIKCLSRECDICKTKCLLYKEFDNSIEVYYMCWKKVKKTYEKNGQQKTTLQTVKDKVITSPKGLINEFENKVGPYMRHVANIISQRRYIKQIKAELSEDQCIIYCDFSENYNTKYANEIQSFHFGSSRQQISLHTSVLYFKKEGTTYTQSFCTLSESLRHDAVAIWEHLLPILRYLETETPQVRSLYFLSDSPSAQYRNRKMFFIISSLHWNFPSLDCVEWNYSEVGHGKGAPDGVGGCLKSTADKIVARGNDIVDLHSLVDHLRKHVKNVIIEVVEETNMFEKELLLPSNLREFTGTLSVHQVIWNADNTKCLSMRRLSCQFEECLHKSTQCEHGQHLGYYFLDDADRNAKEKKIIKSVKDKNKAKDPRLVKSSKNKPKIISNILLKPGSSEMSKIKNITKDIKRQCGLKKINNEQLPKLKLKKKENSPKIIKKKQITMVKNALNINNQTLNSVKQEHKQIQKKIMETNKASHENSYVALSEINITQNNSFWGKISDVEELITPSLTDTVFSTLHQETNTKDIPKHHKTNILWDSDDSESYNIFD